MNRVINPLSLFLLSICCAFAQQKDIKLLKSTINTVSSTTVKLSNSDYTIQQSIGQSGVIGKVNSNNSVIQQGFLNNTLFFTLNNSDNINFEENLEVVVSPNPFIEYVRIEFSTKTKYPISLRVFDMNGKSLIYKEYPASKSIVVPMNKIIVGAYILRIVTGTARFNEKILKLKE